MIVLDTNVVSELMRPEPLERVVTWTDAQPAVELFLTAVTLAELLYGIGRLPDGRCDGYHPFLAHAARSGRLR